MNKAKGFAYCGLACCVCQDEKCAGCRNYACTGKEWCKNFNCCKQKGLKGCWECPDFPCSGSMLDKPRVRAFAKFISQYGEQKLMECLETNEKAGIAYHYDGQLVGDYDKFQTEEEIINFILHGKWFEERSDPIICIEQMINVARELENKCLEYQKINLSQKPSLFFRGVNDYKYGLRPSIGREWRFVGKPVQFDIVSERNLLHRFKRHIYAELKSKSSDWATLFLARHHNLPVRLLDWTSNALVALYFASIYNDKQESRDAALWAFIGKTPFHHLDIFREEQRNDTRPDQPDPYYRWESELDENIKKNMKDKININELQSPLRLKGVRLIYPFDVSSRIVTQSGVFTIQENPWKDLEYLDKEPNWNNLHTFIDIENIFKWRIPSWARPEIVKDLQRHNIDYRTLFPDLDGIAKGLWHTEVLRLEEPDQMEIFCNSSHSTQ
jgi:hypothetical protein